VSSVLARLAPPAEGRRSPKWVIAPALILAFVALIVGFVAGSQEHEATAKTWYDLFFTDTIHMKAWLATGAALLACTQLFTAAWIFGKYPIPKPAWINSVHRWSGRLAFVLILPVAYHCIFKLGFEHGDNRVLVHSLAGSTFFGAYFAKVTIVRLKRFPVWVLPTAGGIVFTVLIAVWYTSALWFFSLVGEDPLF
jgi:Family of unknown function (DUF6529)